MKNVYLIETDKLSRLVKIKDNLFYTTTENIPGGVYQNIYITNDEVKKNGEWVLSNVNEIVKFCSLYCQNSYKKIILTTNTKLNNDCLQTIDDEFLQWFVNNPRCEEVKVENDYLMWRNSEKEKLSDCYKIIIPKEEPCEHFTPTIGCIKDVCSCNKAPFRHQSRVLSTEEVLANRSNAYEFIDFDKKETLEEAAKEFSKQFLNNGENSEFEAQASYLAFIACAKWQQEQYKKMYSKGDLKRYGEFCVAKFNKFESVSLNNEYFEQFKNVNYEI